jgi:hypothetical protein
MHSRPPLTLVIGQSRVRECQLRRRTFAQTDFSARAQLHQAADDLSDRSDRSSYVNHRAPTLRQDPALSRPDDRTAVALTAPTADGHTHHNRAHPEDQNSSRAGCMTAASNRTTGTIERLLPSKIWTIGHRSSDSVTDSLFAELLRPSALSNRPCLGHTTSTVWGRTS